MPFTSTIPEYLFSEYSSYRGLEMSELMNQYAYIFYMFAVLYLLMVHVGPYLIKKPLKLKPYFIAWNLFLSVFSIMGAYFSLPRILDMLFGGFSEPSEHNPIWRNGRKPGLHASMCEFDPEVFFDNRAGVWLWLFTISKIPEMMDTAFLVLQKKKVIFLHWYHHLTVMLYCWHCYAFITPAGMAFSTMNYCVHSIMYTYYFICACGYRHVVRPIAFLITSIQILQMVVGLAIQCYLFYQVFVSPAPCDTNPTNVLYGSFMYFSYLILFSKLYYDSYVKKKPEGSAGRGDAAGMGMITPTPVPAAQRKRGGSSKKK